VRVALYVHCFFPAHFYGTETYTLELARQYRALGIDAQVVTAIFAGEPRAAELVTRYEYQGIPVTCIDRNHLPHARVKETYYQPELAGVHERVLRDLAPDAVHVTHLINHTASLLEVTAALGIPTYATFTDFFGFCFNNKLEAADGSLCAGPSPSRRNCMACFFRDSGRQQHRPALARWLARTGRAHWLALAADGVRRLPGQRRGPIDGMLEDIARRPDTLHTLYGNYRAAVTPTRFLRRAYERNGFTLPLRSIWFGVDIERTPKPARRGGHVPVLGFIGQLARHKGADILLEAFRRLPRGAARLEIYGPSDQDPVHMRELHALAEGHAVNFAGTFEQARLAGVLAGLDALVIPSRWYENAPLALLNALATHTPVIVADVEGLTEFLEPGLNGLAFARGSVDDLERVLRALLQDPVRLAHMSATTNFERTTRTMAEETLQLYDRLPGARA
jgi:glycosyltransferase involved in cell wall biosynthesis